MPPRETFTFNDDAIVNLLRLLSDAAEGAEPFRFLSDELRARAQRSLDLGIACVLRSQVVRAGRLTAWGQQHDAITLLPCAARAYEMASLSTSESASLARFLSQPDPGQEIVAAIEAVADWFDGTAIKDVAYKMVEGGARSLVPAPGEGPWWPRMIDLETDRPVFGDRDYTVHPTLDTVSAERRRSYAWYTDRPEEVLKAVPGWRARLNQPRK